MPGSPRFKRVDGTNSLRDTPAEWLSRKRIAASSRKEFNKSLSGRSIFGIVGLIGIYIYIKSKNTLL